MFLGMTCLWSVACDEKLSTVAGPTPNLEPTFASIQSDIFQTTEGASRRRCLECHTSTGRNPAGGLNLNPDVAYAQLVNATSLAKPGAVRVIPGNPDNSYRYCPGGKIRKYHLEPFNVVDGKIVDSDNYIDCSQYEAQVDGISSPEVEP